MSNPVIFFTEQTLEVLACSKNRLTIENYGEGTVDITLFPPGGNRKQYPHCLAHNCLARDSFLLVPCPAYLHELFCVSTCAQFITGVDYIVTISNIVRPGPPKLL